VRTGEPILLLLAQVLNLAIFSISHKIELKAFHDFELHYSGDAKVYHPSSIHASSFGTHPRYALRLMDLEHLLETPRVALE
jgi:hypothetical protein